ncbi:MAG: ABC transporter ATP-binding protein [Acidobacteriaceae bacterium]|nr:ABC transporter ATP-binding protein [Acidobacteriaceae bacterium]
MLEVRNLTKLYRGVPAVQGVSFELKPGHILGYVGPNGSGKSTTVKCLTGLLEPTSGEILFEGRPVRQNLIAFKRRLGYVPEEPHLYTHLSGLEYLTLTGRLRGMEARSLNAKAEQLLKLFDLSDSRFSPLSAYSKGMRQRVLIAAALLADPDLIILDEPFSGLDVNASLLFRQLLQQLAEQGRMILFSSHVLEVVEKVCSQVVILYRGKVVAQNSIATLRDLFVLPSLVDVFAQLTRQEDHVSRARDIVEVVCGRDNHRPLL